jgi:hypothetical protein
MAHIDLVKTVFKLLGFLPTWIMMSVACALVAARGLVHHYSEFGSEKRMPFSPASQHERSHRRGLPETSVETFGLMYCIVS